MTLTRKIVDAFWARVETSPSGCWLWTGHIDRRFGYGYLFIQELGRSYAAHRIAWAIKTGELPRERIRHQAGCPRHCIRPSHLLLSYAYAIKDRFTVLRVSRERKRQLRKLSKNHCVAPGCEAQLATLAHCREHAIASRERQRVRTGAVRRNRSWSYRF